MQTHPSAVPSCRDYRPPVAPTRRLERGDAMVNAAAIRVCQPGPLAFHRASVSGGIRRLMDTFASGNFGRPLGLNNCVAATLPRISGKTSAAGRARLKSAEVSSRTSPSRSVNGLRFPIFPCLSCIRLAKTDYTDSIDDRRETQHVEPSVQISDRHEPPLRIGKTRIFDDGRAGPVEFRRPRERQAAPSDIPRILGGIETDVHGAWYIRIYGKSRRNRQRYAASLPAQQYLPELPII